MSAAMGTNMGARSKHLRQKAALKRIPYALIAEIPNSFPPSAMH